MATMNDNKANVRKRRLVFSFVVVVDDCLDFSELLVDDADEGGGEGLVPLPEAVGVTVVGRIDFFGMVELRLSFPVQVMVGSVPFFVTFFTGQLVSRLLLG